MSNIFLKMQFGSHVYGTNTPTSDLDYKGLMIPKYKDIILQRAPKNIQQNTNNTNTKNSKDDIDFEIFSLHQFFKLFMEGQTFAYDMIFTPKKFILQDDPIWQHIVNNKDKLLNSKISAFAGYCNSQAAKYSLKGSNLSSFRLSRDFFSKYHSSTKLNSIRDKIIMELIEIAVKDMKYNDKNEPLIKFVCIPHKTTGIEEEYLQVGPKVKVPMTASCKVAYDCFSNQFNKYGERAKMAESNEGVDWKALLHAVRICEEAKELLNTGHITFPRPEAPLLLQIRKGELPYKQVAEIIENGLDDLKIAQTKTSLRLEPDREWIEDFIFNIYSSLGQI